MAFYRGMSTQERRAAYPYRDKYFKLIPGIFGCIWICSQCYKPIFGKDNVVIDHIIPLAKGGKNHISNCTACCRKCNSEKSDKIDYRVIKGKFFKYLETGALRSKTGIGPTLALLSCTLLYIIMTPLRMIHLRKNNRRDSKGAFFLKMFCNLADIVLNTCTVLAKLILIPLTKGNVVSKCIFLAIYIFIIVFLLTEYTSIL